jgi:hypothetical protein
MRAVENLEAPLVSDVAALYVDPRGPYPKLVEHWYDEARDARTYEGPWPVVLHPPCAPWTTLRSLCDRDDEKALGEHAVAMVRQWGGVLEQPAGSKLWARFGLAEPERARDAYGFSVQVDQVAWGHPARKRTWLYFVGVDAFEVRRIIRTGGKVTHWCSGGHVGRGKVPPGIKVCSAQQRRRTPVAFARWLIGLARQVRR